MGCFYVFFFCNWLNLNVFCFFFEKGLILWRKATFFKIRAFLILGF